MDITQKLHNGTCDITLSGPFTFNDHMEFREILNKIALPDIQQIVFHMDGVSFIDSAALGMLLLALDESGKYHKTLTIRGATGQVKKMFDMSRFDTMFKIH